MERHATLLLVEDEHLLRTLVAQFLRGAGFDVVEACDGGQAVARFREARDIDLALIDLNLPVCNGVEVCRQILAGHDAQRILICSAAITPEFERELRAMGIEDFLTKPYHPEALLDRIVRRLDPGPVREPHADVSPIRSPSRT